MVIAVDFIRRLFDTSDFPARWSCGNWTAGLGWLHILSDLAIFGAYMAIPASLAFLARRRRDFPLRPVLWLFVCFILFCGLTHLIEAIIFYEPVYRFAGVMKLATALVSWATVIALFGVMPEALALPGMRAANEQLRAENERRSKAEAALETARSDLERRTGQLALREHRMKLALESAAVGAVRWEIDTGTLLWELGLRDGLRRLDMEVHDLADWSAVLAPGEALSFRLAASEAASQSRTLYTSLSLQVGGRLQPAMLAARADPEVAGQPRTMTGMIRLIVD